MKRTSTLLPVFVCFAATLYCHVSLSLAQHVPVQVPQKVVSLSEESKDKPTYPLINCLRPDYAEAPRLRLMGVYENESERLDVLVCVRPVKEPFWTAGIIDFVRHRTEGRLGDMGRTEVRADGRLLSLRDCSLTASEVDPEGRFVEVDSDYISYEDFQALARAGRATFGMGTWKFELKEVHRQEIRGFAERVKLAEPQP